MTSKSEIEKAVINFKEKSTSLDNVKAQIKELEKNQRQLTTSRNDSYREINKLQIDHEEIHPDLVLDYCFRHFDQEAYQRVPAVNEFLGQVKELQNERMLTVRVNEMLETGVISGEGIFSVKRTHRYLHVPVEKHQVLDLSLRGNRNWASGEGAIWINDDIFPVKRLRIMDRLLKSSKLTKLLDKIGEKAKPLIAKPGHVWDKDYSREGPYIGGPGPSNWFVYLGDNRVETGLKKHSIINVPKTTARIPALE
ncbi:hypothetical protein GOV13_04000 [Candidatus Pacearchaeota archaeon]|nr:hypothetical protein [Candidatus Pacearchaeota archaeon]